MPEIPDPLSRIETRSGASGDLPMCIEQLSPGLLIRQLRRSFRMSQRELSRRSGVRQPRVCAVEAGKITEIATYDRLVSALGAELIFKARQITRRETIAEELAAERLAAEERRRARRQALRLSRGTRQ